MNLNLQENRVFVVRKTELQLYEMASNIKEEAFEAELESLIICYRGMSCQY
jgi:hypothetical protein